MNTPVNFEIAKLLKEKGFDEPCCEFYYMENNPNKLEESFNKSKKWDFNFENEYQFPCKSISAPTIAEVVMWCFSTHKIWIECLHRGDMGDFTFKISKLKKGWRIEPHYIYENGFNSPTEAYEAAIEYTLNKLL